MKTCPYLQRLELGSCLDHERVSEFIRQFTTPVKHLQEDNERQLGFGAGRITTNQGVPSIEIWLRNLVEYPAGVVDAGEGREGTSSDELAGGVRVEEDACTEHLGMDLFELLYACALVYQGKKIVIDGWFGRFWMTRERNKWGA